MQEKLIRLAVYGTLMTGERNERWGADARRRVPCTIRGVLYDTGWGFPAMQLSDNPDDLVHGEIITLPEADLPAIDRLEGVPRLYQRVEVMAVSDAGITISAFCYVMERGQHM